jgi:hypothetical protein
MRGKAVMVLESRPTVHAMRRPSSSYHEKLIRTLRRAVTLFLWGSCVALVGCSTTLAQITIKNPDNLSVPDNKPQVLLRMACRVVAEEFHIHDPAKLDFPLILVLGEPFRYTADDDNHLYTIYLDRWDDIRFTAYAVMLASHLVVVRGCYKKMVVETLRRASRVSPVQADALRNRP